MPLAAFSRRSKLVTEGFDTLDLKEANASPAELASQTRCIPADFTCC
jgi:hypothetical protein